MEKVTYKTRRAQKGTKLLCPNCAATAIVLHFNWNAITCQKCGDSPEKTSWYIKPKNINYVAISRAGDIPGMSNDGYGEILPIADKGELATWREFNRQAKLYRAAVAKWASAFQTQAIQPAKRVEKLNKAAQKINDNRATIIYAMYGMLGDVWSKWHNRTNWVVKKI